MKDLWIFGININHPRFGVRIRVRELDDFPIEEEPPVEPDEPMDEP